MLLIANAEGGVTRKLPNRILKESVCISEKIASLSDFEYRLWTGLILIADDFGRGDARPAIIKGRVFPLRERITYKDIDAALRSLAGKGCISLYTVGGKSYFYFPNWSEHQRIRKTVPKYPAPCENDGPDNLQNIADIYSQEFTKTQDLPQVAASCGELRQVAARAREESESESESESNNNICASADARVRQFFDSLWQLYPKKKGKSAVSKKSQNELFAAGFDLVAGAIESYKAEIERLHTDEQYVMYGSTFFNGRWRDYVDDSGSVGEPDVSVRPETQVGKLRRPEDVPKGESY